MNRDHIDNLFEGLTDAFDIHEPRENHAARFLNKLENNSNKNKTTHFKKWWYAAASIIVLVSVSIAAYTMGSRNQNSVATVAPELYASQEYFTGVINQELEKLQKEKSPETKRIVEDAVLQIEKLENDYNILKKDLLDNGADKRIIYAMISNLQKRIELLQNVLETIDEVKILKTESHETYS